MGSKRVDMRHGPATGFAVANLTVLQRKECVVPAQAYVPAWMNPSSELPHEDRTRRNRFASEDFHSATLAVAIATVA